MNKKQKDIISFVILGILFIIILVRNNYGIPCIVYKTTGLYCPGCGGTRMFLSLLKLDIYQAFRYNMLFTIAIPFFIIHFICKIFLKLKYKIPNLVWFLLITIVILYGILRNIPYFSFLGPTEI